MSGTRLELSPSWVLAGAIVALHATAAACILLVLAGYVGVALAAAFLALGTAAAWARALHRSRASVRALEVSGNEIYLELGDGRRVRAEPGTGRHVNRFLVTLPLSRPRRTLLVTRDMLPAEEFRRLRLWALWGKLPVAAKQLPA